MKLAKKVLKYKELLSTGGLADELKARGDWIVAYLDHDVAWPTRPQKHIYRNTEFLVVPFTNDAHSAIAVNANGKRANEVREAISRFLSVLSWVDGRGITIRNFGGGSHITPYTKHRIGGSICNELDFLYFPEVADPKAMLALALMREGRGLRHPAYSFLSFWRVLEVALGRKNIEPWISDTLSLVHSSRAIEVMEMLSSKEVENIAKHLYVSGRCAVAHAGSHPIVDPDKPEDGWRLFQELPLVEELATLSIEQVFRVKTTSTIYNEHLHELSGFKKFLGDDVVRRIIAKDTLLAGTDVDLPIIDFGLVGHSFNGFKCLEPLAISFAAGVATLTYGRPDGRLQIVFDLLFAEERLYFDVENGIFAAPDDSSPEYAELRADIHEFMKWYFLNGRLEIFDSETGVRIAWKEEFMPVNVVVDPNAFDVEVNRLRELGARRRRPSLHDN